MDTVHFLSILFILSVVSTTLAAEENCPAIYQRYSRMHTFCKKANAKCDIQDSSVSDDDQDLILKLHNYFRNRVAYGKEKPLEAAGGMLKMQWDDNLAKLAQKHANQCEKKADCEDCRQTHAFESVGQSIYSTSAEGEENVAADWNSTLFGWFQQKDGQKYDRKSECRYDPNKDTQEFTQMIWGKTWRVGCGYVAFKKDNQQNQLYVCNYGPTGNVAKTPIYDVGDIASTITPCPENTCRLSYCKEKDRPIYPDDYILCNVLSKRAPQPKRSKSYLYYCNFENITQCNVTSEEGKSPWNVIHTLSGPYISVEVNKSVSGLFINTPMKIQPELCIYVTHRSGRIEAGNDTDVPYPTVATYNSKMKLLEIKHFTLYNDTEWHNSIFNLKNEDGIFVEINAYDGSEYIKFFEIKQIGEFHCRSLDYCRGL